MPVRRACLPSTLSKVEYLDLISLKIPVSKSQVSTHIHMPRAKLKYNHHGPCNLSCLAEARNLGFSGLAHPYWTDHVGHEDFNEKHVEHDEHEPEKGHHVGCDPHGQELDEGIPLEPSSKGQLR